MNVGLGYLVAHYTMCVTEWGLDVAPDFQRAYVWTDRQKVSFVEYFLRGGSSGVDIYTNCPTWNSMVPPLDPKSWFVLVDGKQRLDALLGFLNNEFQVFGGSYFRDFTDKPRITSANLRWHVNDLKTREECLQWYLDLNSGGTVHTQEDLDVVRNLLANQVPYVRPEYSTILEHARLNREAFRGQGK